MLVFPCAQPQEHIKQHHSTMEEQEQVLDFPLAQEQVHIKQHHSTLE
jgi:hypothetical protein